MELNQTCTFYLYTSLEEISSNVQSRPLSECQSHSRQSAVGWVFWGQSRRSVTESVKISRVGHFWQSVWKSVKKSVKSRKKVGNIHRDRRCNYCLNFVPQSDSRCINISVCVFRNLNKLHIHCAAKVKQWFRLLQGGDFCRKKLKVQTFCFSQL